MTSCNLLGKWPEMSHDERLDALNEIVHEALSSWGFQPVPVVGGYDNEYTPAEFDTTSQTIQFQDQYLDDSGDSEDSFFDIVGIALHEATHVAEQQSGIAVPHLDVAWTAGLMAFEMFEQCESAADSVTADLPPYPFQSNYAGNSGGLDN